MKYLSLISATVCALNVMADLITQEWSTAAGFGCATIWATFYFLKILGEKRESQSATDNN